MRVNRVFCYSKNEARQNGNKLPILELVLTSIIGIVALVVIAIINDSMALLAIMVFIFLGLIFMLSFILVFRLRTRLTAFATSDENRIFKVISVNNGQGLYFGGVAAGSMIDQLANSSKDIGRDIGGVVGAAAQFYVMNRQAQYMSHPEIVARMVESAPDITGAEVIEILKVHSITERKKSVKVNCDYKSLRKGKVKYNKKLNVEKSYNQFNDLMKVINSHK